MRLFLAGLAMVLCSVTEAGELASHGVPAPEKILATPLRTVSSTPAPIGDFFAWVDPGVCDENGNAYFLVATPIAPGHGQGGPRAVLRISADGQRRFSFDPAAVPEFASAHELHTIGFALGPDGGLFALVWYEMGGQSGQYILSFDKNGEYRSNFEVDSSEIVAQQLEVFGSGQFLLRGARPSGEPRLAILSATGGKLKDVVGWSPLPKSLEEPSVKRGMVRRSQVARGDDGRIYLAEPDAREGMDAVYALGPHGQSQEIFTLRPMPDARELVGWKAAGGHFAAAYLRRDPQPDSSSSDGRGRYWIAVYDAGAGGRGAEPKVYGPAPGAPICYRHEESGDRFTFLRDGKLVTMSAP